MRFFEGVSFKAASSFTKFYRENEIVLFAGVIYGEALLEDDLGSFRCTLFRRLVGPFGSSKGGATEGITIGEEQSLKILWDIIEVDNIGRCLSDY